MERETIKSTLKKEKQHCSKAKQFQTILYYVKARVNSGRLIFIGDETRSENMLSPSHILMGNIHPNKFDETVSTRDSHR
ncbi:hypothetical protein T08_8262 [Trichinella sp. T8]|nr:hypothetical protein T08_8262 [Trichinella sp. T8]